MVRLPHGVAFLPACWLALGLAVLPAAHAQDKDVSRGESLFHARCGGCHSLSENRTGPALRGVLVRVAGKAPDFEYSKALRAANHVWTRDKLLAWLSGPEALVPGQAMDYSLDAADERLAVVEFLATVASLPVTR